MGVSLPPALGVVTVLNFHPPQTPRPRYRRLVLIDKEVNSVARTLLQHGIEVTAIHIMGCRTPTLFTSLLGH